MADEGDRIKVAARQLFPGPVYPIAVVGLPEIPGLRHNGQRWVDETHPDAPGVIAEQKAEPTQWSDLVTYRKTKLPPEPKVRKSRRRGGF